MHRVVCLPVTGLCYWRENVVRQKVWTLPSSPIRNICSPKAARKWGLTLHIPLILIARRQVLREKVARYFSFSNWGAIVLRKKQPGHEMNRNRRLPRLENTILCPLGPMILNSCNRSLKAYCLNQKTNEKVLQLAAIACTEGISLSLSDSRPGIRNAVVRFWGIRVSRGMGLKTVVDTMLVVICEALNL